MCPTRSNFSACTRKSRSRIKPGVPGRSRSSAAQVARMLDEVVDGKGMPSNVKDAVGGLLTLFWASWISQELRALRFDESTDRVQKADLSRVLTGVTGMTDT